MNIVRLLRDFPLVIDHGQQIAFSTLAHLLDCANFERRFQEEFAAKFSKKNADVLTIEERSTMLRSTWASVSALYYFDKIASIPNSIIYDVYKTSKLQSYCKKACKLRIARDHVAENIRNLRKAKRLTPTNGGITWTFSPKISGSEAVFGQQFFTIDPNLKRNTFELRDGIDGIAREYDNVTLHAFNSSINLSRAMDALVDFANLLEVQLELAIKTGMDKGWPPKSSLTEGEQVPICVHFVVRMAFSENK